MPAGSWLETSGHVVGNKLCLLVAGWKRLGM